MDMTPYEFSLEQEVFMEKAAEVLGDIYRYEVESGIKTKDLTHPVEAMYTLVWKAKQDILCAKDENDLTRIDAECEMARKFLKIISE